MANVNCCELLRRHSTARHAIFQTHREEDCVTSTKSVAATYLPSHPFISGSPYLCSPFTRVPPLVLSRISCGKSRFRHNDPVCTRDMSMHGYRYCAALISYFLSTCKYWLRLKKFARVLCTWFSVNQCQWALVSYTGGVAYYLFTTLYFTKGNKSFNSRVRILKWFLFIFTFQQAAETPAFTLSSRYHNEHYCLL